MELYQLKTFVAVAEHGHLTRAAERLAASQPAVSAHIKALEEELGVRLFIRTPKGMQLTSAGEALRNQAENILAAAASMKVAARAHQDQLSGQLRIGLNSTPELLRVKEIYQAVSGGAGRIELRFQQAISGKIIESVKNKELDAGFVFGSYRVPGLHFLPLDDLELVIAAPPAWRARINRASLEELADLPWIGNPPECPYRQLVHELFTDHGLALREAVVADQEAAILSMVSAGIGLSFILGLEARPAEQRGDLVIWPQRSFAIQLSFVYSAERQHDPLLEVLIDGVNQSWPHLGNDRHFSAGETGATPDQSRRPTR